MDKRNMREFIIAYKNGEITGDDGWYDWFCKTSSLQGKTKRMMPIVRRLVNSPKINPEMVYVWFKNNCPCYDNLYDDVRIADIQTGNVLYTITPSEGAFNDDYGLCSVWGYENNFKEPLYKGTRDGMYEWFGVPKKSKKVAA